jgi:hypothetical protein
VSQRRQEFSGERQAWERRPDSFGRASLDPLRSSLQAPYISIPNILQAFFTTAFFLTTGQDMEFELTPENLPQKHCFAPMELFI